MIYEIYNELKLILIMNYKNAIIEKIHGLFLYQIKILVSIKEEAENVYSDMIIIGDNIKDYC